MLRTFSFLALFMVLVSSPSSACRYVSRPLEQNLAAAKTAFIGVMRTDEMGLAIFNVEKGIASVKDGDEFPVETQSRSESSCNIEFTPGQIWIYMGTVAPSGSFMLMDEYGRIIEESAKIAKDKFGYDVAQSPSIIHGTMQDTCAPWDGAAFRVTLDNGASATVYDRFQDFKTGTAFYTIGQDAERMGGGSINICDKDGKNCQQYTGRLTFGFADSATASGQLQINDGEHKRAYTFRVKREAGQAVCG